MKVEVTVLGSPSLTVLMVSACGYKASLNFNSALLVIVGVFGDQRPSCDLLQQEALPGRF